MISIRTALLAAGALALVTAPPVSAHHSASMFDHANLKRLTGVVKQFKWVNPHTSVVFVADRTAEVWNIESTSPGILTRAGWTKRSLNPGDRIEISFAPMRSGGRAGLLMNAKNLTTGVSLPLRD